jgi:hypothetical protein
LTRKPLSHRRTDGTVPSGWSHAGIVDKRTGVWRPTAYGENSRLYTSGYVIARCAGFADPAFYIAAAYIEYQNVDDPDDTVAVPAVDPADGLAAYDDLVATPGRDFLRVLLRVRPELSVLPGYEAYFGPGEGNVLTFFVQTAGTAGVLGRPFSHTVNSKVIGVMLVATPTPNDRTKDVPFARLYYTGADQVLKVPNGQISVEYSVPFGLVTS